MAAAPCGGGTAGSPGAGRMVGPRRTTAHPAGGPAGVARCGCGLQAAMLLACLLLPAAGRAAITLSGGGPVVPAAGEYRLTEALGLLRGANLFHSFGLFDLAGGETARFTGSSALANILVRVTGGASSIDGTIDSLDYPGANLFLINPAGIHFGAGARVDVGGAFHASTADYLRLADGTRFDMSVALDADSPLTSAPPVAFGFLGEAPAPISALGADLAVAAGQRLSLVGGAIDVVGGSLSAPGGRIDLAAAGSAGEVIPSAPGSPTALDASGPARLAPVSLGGAASLDAGGAGGGTVLIRGGRIVLSGATIAASTKVAGGAGGESMRGVDVEAREAVRLQDGAAISTNVFSAVADPSGGVRIRAPEVEITGGGFIESNAFSASTGAVGDVDIRAGTLRIAQGGFVRVETGGTGDAGAVRLRADTLQVSDSGLVYSLVLGTSAAGGALVIDAGELEVSNLHAPGFLTGITAQTLFGATGKAGDVTVTADSLYLAGDSTVISTPSFGAGAGGDLHVAIRDTASLSGNPFNPFNTGVFATTFYTGDAGDLSFAAGRLELAHHVSLVSSTFGTGRAGNVSVTAGSIDLRDAGYISSSGLFGYGGGAGDITLTADSLTATGSATSPDPFGTDFTGVSTSAGPYGGSGGDIRIDAGSLRLDSRAQVNAASFGPGPAGRIDIDAGALRLTGGATILASAFGTGTGGAIDIAAGEVLVSGENPNPVPDVFGIPRPSPSGIGSETGFAGAGAGDVRVSAERIRVRDRGVVSTSTLGGGAGGTVELRAVEIRIENGGLVAALSEGAGLAGDIVIRARDQLVLADGGITTQAVLSDGGNVDIRAGRLVYLRDSEITSAVGSGTGAGGNIVIDPTFVILQSSRIIADAFGGPGGNITIVAGHFLSTEDSLVRASSAQSIDGVVEIDAPDTDVSTGVAVLPASYFDATALLREACGVARAPAGSSSLVLAGRGGVPPEPDGYLPALGIAGAPAQAGPAAAPAPSASWQGPWPWGCPL